MFERLKWAFGLAQKRPEQPAKKLPVQPYALSFPPEIFDGGMSKEKPYRALIKGFPFASWLSQTIKDKHPALAAQIDGKNISEQYKLIAEAAGFEQTPKGGIEAVSLHLLIHLENGEVLKAIQKNYPERYRSADQAQGENVNPLKFTVQLLEEFGVECRTYPACYGVLRDEVLRASVKPVPPSGFQL